MRRICLVLLAAGILIAAIVLLPVPARALPNLQPFHISGWESPLVPRATDDATVTDVPLSASLTGWQYETYWNASIANWSDDPMTEGFVWRIYVDNDVYLDYSYTTAHLDAYHGVYSINRGPHLVAGGRHTFELRIDEDDYIAESDEDDNNLAYQFIWTPFPLAQGTPCGGDAPPDMDGGWSSVPSGEVLWYNADGFGFTGSAWWNAVWLRADDNADDYDLRLHEASTGCQDGFAANLGYSSRPAGFLDAVVVNRNTMGSQDWNVGVLNQNGGDDRLTLKHVGSTSYSFGYPVELTMPLNESIQLWEFQLTTYSGWVMFELEADDPVDGLWLNYFDTEFETGSLDTADGYLYTTDGYGRGFREITDLGYHCAAIVRDPTLGSDALDYTLNITIGRPDFTPYKRSGWHSACVPRSDMAGTETSVTLPDTLYGNSATYPNLCMRNETPVPYPNTSPYVKLHWEYDETPVSWVGFHPIAAWDVLTWNGSTPHNVPGGRHTYTLRVDKNEEITEADETNNIYGEQYCWSPSVLSPGLVSTRTVPAEADAGYETINSGETFWYNCEGLRVPTGTSYWRAMAIVPMDEATDIDVRIHETLEGVKDGFAVNLEYSSFGPGETDYVVVNFNQTSQRAFDAGVVNQGGLGSYRAQSLEETYLATYPDGTYGPYGLSSLGLMQLHEVYLDEGEYLIKLEHESGDADVGLTLHPADLAYQWKGSYVAGGFADDNGPGQDEQLEVTIPANGYYCLAVWKSGTADLNLTAGYTLKFVWEYSATPDDDLPDISRVTGAYPNPFNPCTNITFDLATDAAVSIDVFDVQGRRVRRLLDERRPAGRHTAVWNGLDDGGTALPSGVYLARVTAGGMLGLEKLVLVR